YELKDGNITACLATGFSRYNQNNNSQVFNGTQPVRIFNDSLLNQVVLLSQGEEQQWSAARLVFHLTQRLDLLARGSSAGFMSVMSLFADLMVNLVTLTVTGLRILLVKTVVFNILMTFRLWISQCE
uniref:Uncharacterized protein n=1 Tax=Mola mola TaxID=94237 RepID=A0A3Q3X2D2_MOLML